MQQLPFSSAAQAIENSRYFACISLHITLPKFTSVVDHLLREQLPNIPRPAATAI